jgi:hypothetical protein
MASGFDMQYFHGQHPVGGSSGPKGVAAKAAPTSRSYKNNSSNKNQL